MPTPISSQPATKPGTVSDATFYGARKAMEQAARSTFAALKSAVLKNDLAAFRALFDPQGAHPEWVKSPAQARAALDANRP